MTHFFATPEESQTLLGQTLEESAQALQCYVQVSEPGILVVPVSDLGEAEAVAEARGTVGQLRLVLTARSDDRPAMADAEPRDGMALLNTLLIDVPYIDGDSYYVGAVGVKLQRQDASTAAPARRLQSRLRRLATTKLMVRMPNGDAAPSETRSTSGAVQLAVDRGLQMRQHGVLYTFVPRQD